MTTQTQHTPGPWIVNCCTQRGTGSYRHLITREEGPEANEIAIVPCDMNWSDQYIGADDPIAEANARLIAAAPELLEALRNFVCDCPPQGSSAWFAICDDARAALAKAVGP